MAYITPTAEREELGGGRYRTTINLAPVAYEDASGNLRAISDRWADGDATYPHVISAARLRVRTAPNGDRLLLPVPGDDDAWFSISSPFINNGTNWIQPSLGSFSRSGNQLTATAANVITRINHAGHYIKAEYELLNGWTPNNGQFAYRVGLQGLTRDGGTLLYNGVPVMSLRKPVAYDWDNQSDIRTIAHEFVQLGGNWYILFTLPSLAGMSRPVVDPTFESQPDATAGKDANIDASNADTNFATDTVVKVDSVRFNGLIEFDTSSIPATATVTAASLAINISNSGGGTLNTFRILPANDWVEAQVTWNNRKTSTAWAGSAGCNTSGTDYDATVSGSVDVTTTGAKTITMTADGIADVQSWVDGTAANNGFRWNQNSGNSCFIDSSDNATAGNRPKLTIEYTVGPTYTLTAAAGSATFTGQAAGLLAGRKLTAAAGSATFTGQAANLLAGRKLTAAAGSATFTGQAAGLRANRKLTAAAGSMTLTGYDAALNYSAAEIAVNANVYIRETASAIVEV